MGDSAQKRAARINTLQSATSELLQKEGEIETKEAAMEAAVEEQKKTIDDLQQSYKELKNMLLMTQSSVLNMQNELRDSEAKTQHQVFSLQNELRLLKDPGASQHGHHGYRG